MYDNIKSKVTVVESGAEMRLQRLTGFVIKQSAGSSMGSAVFSAARYLVRHSAVTKSTTDSTVVLRRRRRTYLINNRFAHWQIDNGGWTE